MHFDYNKLPFDKNEVKIIFDNSKCIEYNYVVMEVKLNANNLIDLISQLKRA